MARSSTTPGDPDVLVHGLQADYRTRGQHLVCSRCEKQLECVEQHRRAGTWLGSLICPNCRSEYFYAYRWGRLTRKS